MNGPPISVGVTNIELMSLRGIIEKVFYRTRWSSFTHQLIGYGISPQKVPEALKTAEDLGWIESRSASLSKLGEPGDDELPVSSEKRAETRQYRRVVLSKAEEMALPKPPKPVSLESVLNERRRNNLFRSPPAIAPDPLTAEVRRLKKREQDQAEQIAELLARVQELEDQPPPSRRRRR